jgi:glucokinase
MVLAGEIGGTKVHLARFERDGAGLRKVDETLIPTTEIVAFADTAAEWTGGGRGLLAASFGVAGPVLDGDVDGANLPWPLRAAAVSRALGGIPVRLLNDLVASAHGLETLGPEDLETLQPGTERPGNRALVSPGTGLGECLLLRHEGAFLPVTSEGGHADFAARTDEEIDLLRYLRSIWGRVCVERVVSGPGLVNVFCWLRDTGVIADDSGIAAGPGDSAPASRISQAALAGTSRIAEEALRVWTGAFGAEAANVVLRGFAVGGVFLGGGIPLRVLPALRKGAFLEAFRAKPPYETLLEQLPIQVVRSPETTLRGAARMAWDLVPG